MTLAVICLSLMLITTGTHHTANSRHLMPLPLILTGVIELLLVGQAIVLVTRLQLGDRPQSSTILVLAYLVGVLLVPPAGTLWALGDHRSRWGNAVLAVTGLATGTMVVRLWALWQSPTGELWQTPR